MTEYLFSPDPTNIFCDTCRYRMDTDGCPSTCRHANKQKLEEIKREED